jgi:hypothetical protein
VDTHPDRDGDGQTGSVSVSVSMWICVRKIHASEYMTLTCNAFYYIQFLAMSFYPFCSLTMGSAGVCVYVCMCVCVCV